MNYTNETLGSVATYINGRAFKPSEWKTSGLPIVRIQNLTGESSKFNYTTEVFEDKFKIHNGDLLFAWSASLGAHYWKGEDAWLNQHIFKVLNNEKVEKGYLYYFLKNAIASLYEKTHGAGMVHITKGQFLNTPILLPPIKEQKRIVNKIEELFSELDSAVDTLKKTKEQLAVYRQSVLKDAFDENFETALFGEIMQSRLGKMLDAAKNIGKPQKYLRNINVRWLGFDLADLQEMKIEDSECEKYSLKNGDLIMCEGGEPGRCAVWDKGDGMFFQKALHRIRFNGKENPKFYMYYFLLLAQSDGLKKYFTGSGIKHLTGQSLVKIVVPVAPLKKQNEIIKKIESQFTVCENIVRTVNDALTQADAMRQSILKKAFEGSL